MAQDHNIVDVLLADHEDVRALCLEVERATGEGRRETFHQLRELLVRHEVAEQEIVRPLSRRSVGDQVPDARLDEEAAAEQTLAELEKLDVDSNDFMNAFGDLRAAVETHARNEETQEFPTLLAETEPSVLLAAGRAYDMAKKRAPEPPHQATLNTTAADLLIRPLAATVDRARDAVLKAIDAVRE